MHSISTDAPKGSEATPTQVRAGILPASKNWESSSQSLRVLIVRGHDMTDLFVNFIHGAEICEVGYVDVDLDHIVQGRSRCLED